MWSRPIPLGRALHDALVRCGGVPPRTPLAFGSGLSMLRAQLDPPGHTSLWVHLDRNRGQVWNFRSLQAFSLNLHRTRTGAEISAEPKPLLRKDLRRFFDHQAKSLAHALQALPTTRLPAWTDLAHDTLPGPEQSSVVLLLRNIEGQLRGAATLKASRSPGSSPALWTPLEQGTFFATQPLVEGQEVELLADLDDLLERHQETPPHALATSFTPANFQPVAKSLQVSFALRLGSSRLQPHHGPEPGGQRHQLAGRGG